MLRTIVGVIAGFLAWLIVWIGIEKLLSAIWPESFGVQQLAFEAAVGNGGPFTADTSLLLKQIVLGPIASVTAGFLTALVARENKRALLVLCILIVALGVLKAVMTWQYVPIWFHVVFTALLVPMTLLGGRLKITR